MAGYKSKFQKLKEERLQDTKVQAKKMGSDKPGALPKSRMQIFNKEYFLQYN